MDRYADLAAALAITFAYSLAHRGPLRAIVGTVAACGFILANYVTKEFAIRHERTYPNDILNRLKRRDLRLLLTCLV